MRPEPPFYVGRTRASSIGWTRIGITLAAGAVLVVLMAQRSTPLGALLVAALFGALALWTWMGQSTRFVVDEHGVTVSLGGFLPRRPWPLEDFRTVQLRELPQSRVGVTLGGYGWRRGRASTPQPSELTPVGDRKIYTVDALQRPYRMLVTRPGTMVEMMGRGETCYILSPEDPQATAEAIDQALRARR
ncbi:hypothetical protein [Brachybacterium saurashtrense]|uniref:Bacterial Pleckstrin homology domain-containing protein n=1 Tax=Brachybacterium saurashtrense TaxID=556288 RepID=A0A345YLB7_9MICO|nr:hypothetical protein [Brachybacterium saurashtrense]AXK44719.1 hypothetical protein DWV08_03145 [Brachybacterium saurashtrense]RRR23331.1 hypothetical protein DXU92_08275 [Brachybacterium saurashtrense]